MLLTCQGTHGARLTFDGSTVTITRKGSGEKRFNVASITALQFREPQFFGRAYFEFTMPGAVERRPGQDVGRRAYPDENTFVFSKQHLGEARKMRDAIDAAMAAVHGRPGVPPGQPAVPPGAPPAEWTGSVWRAWNAGANRWMVWDGSAWR